ncbi:MAG: hypothetical protein M3Q24_01225 [bacterium]|nr:hypothetical protein [bacterium]
MNWDQMETSDDPMFLLKVVIPMVLLPIGVALWYRILNERCERKAWERKPFVVFFQFILSFFASLFWISWLIYTSITREYFPIFTIPCLFLIPLSTLISISRWRDLRRYLNS